MVVVCVQDGAVDLLRELKSFNMSLKLLQVGVIIQYCNSCGLVYNLLTHWNGGVCVCV